MLSENDKRILCNKHKFINYFVGPKVLLHNITSDIASLDLILPYIDKENLWEYMFNIQYDDYYSINDCEAPLLLKLLQALPENKIQDYLNMKISGVVNHHHHGCIKLSKIILDDIDVGKALIKCLPLDLILSDKELLEFAIAHTAPLQQKLGVLTQIQMRRYLTQKFGGELPLIHMLASNHKLLNIALERLTKDEQLDFVMLTTDRGETVLDFAIFDKRSLEICLNIYPQSERLNAVAYRGNTPLLNQVFADTEKFMIIYSSLSLEQKLELINHLREKDDFINLLNNAEETVLACLSQLPQENITQILRSWASYDLDDYIRTYEFILYNWQPHTLHHLIDIIDKKQLWCTSLTGYSIFSCSDLCTALQNRPNTFIKIFNVLPQREKCNLYSARANDNDTFISLANNDVFIAIIEALPKFERIKACLLKDRYGTNRLHCACMDGCYDVVESILKLIPKEKIADVLQAKNQSGQSMINLSMRDKELLVLISRYFPRGFIFDTDGQNTTLLHQAMRDETEIDVLLTTLKLLGPLNVIESCSIQSLGFPGQPSPLTITAEFLPILGTLKHIPNPWLRYHICCYSDSHFTNVFINLDARFINLLASLDERNDLWRIILDLTMPEAKQTEIMLKLNLINRLRLNPANESQLAFWAKQVTVGGTSFKGVKIPHQIKLLYKVIVHHFDDDLAHFKQAIRDAFVAYNHSWSAFFKVDKCFNSCAMQALKAHADVTNVEDFRALTHG